MFFGLFKATNIPGGPGLVEHGGSQSQGSLKVICGSPHLKKLVGAFLGPGGLNSTCPFCVGRLVPQVKPVVKY